MGGLEFLQPDERLCSRVSDIGPSATGLEPQANVGFGFGIRSKAHRAKSIRRLDLGLSLIVGDPGPALDAHVGIVDQEPPFAPGGADRLFEPVEDVVDVPGMREIYAAEINIKEVFTRAKGQTTGESCLAVARGVDDAFATQRGATGNLGPCSGPIRKERPVFRFGSRVAGDARCGDGRGVDVHCRHGMRSVRCLAATGVSKPRLLPDTVVGHIGDKEPTRLTGFSNARLEPVIERVGIVRRFKDQAREVEFDRFSGFDHTNARVESVGVKSRRRGNRHEYSSGWVPGYFDRSRARCPHERLSLRAPNRQRVDLSQARMEWS